MRDANPSDTGSLYALRARAILAAGTAFYSSAQLRAWAQSITLEQLSLNVETAVLIAEWRDNLTGFAWLRDDVLWGIYVEPSKRRLGIGSLLLSGIEHRARSNGRREMWVSASLNSVEFYSANGYQPRSSFCFSMQLNGSRIDFEALEMWKGLK